MPVEKSLIRIAIDALIHERRKVAPLAAMYNDLHLPEHQKYVIRYNKYSNAIGVLQALLEGRIAPTNPSYQDALVSRIAYYAEIAMDCEPNPQNMHYWQTRPIEQLEAILHKWMEAAKKQPSTNKHYHDFRLDGNDDGETFFVCECCAEIVELDTVLTFLNLNWAQAPSIINPKQESIK